MANERKSDWKRAVGKRLVIYPAAAYVLLIASAVLLENKFIYFPIAYPVGDWVLPSGAEDVHFDSLDGTKLHGWWLPAEEAERTIILSHGNGGNITHRSDKIAAIRDVGINVFIYDYRGYGRSEGSPYEEGLYLDGEAAWVTVTERFDVEPASVILYGESLGSAIATEVALRRDVSAVILEAPFTNVADMARKILPFAPVWALRHKYDNLEKIGRIGVPVLIIHGTDDTTIPFSHGLRLYEAASEPKSFLKIDGAGHNDIDVVGRDALVSGLNEFLGNR